jgi:hypothetical protein
MAPTDFEQLERMLVEERPEPDPAAAGRIDERVRKARARRRLPRLAWPSARRLTYAGAAATLLVGLVVGVGQIGDEGGPGGDMPVTEPGTVQATGAAEAQPEAAEDISGFLSKKSGRATRDAARVAPLAAGDVAADSVLPPSPGGGLAPKQDERVVERSASMTISGDPDEVRRMADDVVEITERLGGIVISANVDERPDQPRQSTASLEIAVPVDKLDQALSEISDVGSVEARSQSDFDVTAEAVSVRNRLNNARDTLNALQARLDQATDAVEIEQLRVQIARAERRVASRKAEAQRLANRTQFARVFVGVVANGHGADDGDWSIGDAWDDSVDVLRTMAGIGLVTAAVVIPLALLISLVYVLTARSRRRARESALDES